MRTIRSLLVACSAALALAGIAFAQAPAAPASGAAPSGAPAGFVAPALPRPDETNAERARSQPGNNAPFWRSVRGVDGQKGYSSLPATEAGVLIQSFVKYPGAPYLSAGEAWRQVRNRWIIPYGGSLFVLVLAAILLFFFARGPLGGRVPDTGRTIERFSTFERAAHLLVAATFTLLALSGLVMAFGKFILLPVTGATLFGWLSFALKTLHNVVGPLFIVSLMVVILGFVRDNLPRRGDLTWLSKAGGLLSGQEVPSHRFNAGEKIIFWGGAVVLGLLVSGSGLVLDMLLPDLAYTRAQMQVWHMVHAISALLMMTLFLGHIYLGTIGMKGAYAGMRSGRVDEAWAREHHALWLEDIQAGKLPSTPSATTTQVGPAARA